MAQSVKTEQEKNSHKLKETVDLPHLRIPFSIKLPLEGHKNWLKILSNAETLVKEDTDLQYKAAKGLRLKERRLPSEVLGRIYAQYCDLINKMYDIYVNSIQLQRAAYVLEIVGVLVKRLFELRNELVHLIVNDYVYVDLALVQLRMTPFDIQIVVPYHFPLEARPDSMEQILQKMWTESIRRLNRPAKVKSVLSTKSVAPQKSALFDDDEDLDLPPREEVIEVVEEEEEETVPASSEHTIISLEFIHTLLIQRHERFREFYVRDFRKKCEARRAFFKKKIEPVPIRIKIRAAKLIQMFYRVVMNARRQRILDLKRDVLLGMVPDFDKRPLKYEDENEKLLARRRERQKAVQKQYNKEFDFENKRIIFFKKDNQVEDITAHIREWLLHWYYGYGFFPPYPYADEGGTVLVITEQYETIDERRDEDERIKKATKGKNKDQLKEERAQAKLDAQIKKELEIENKKKEKIALFKARCNPQTDPGYEVKQSEFKDNLVEVLRRYRLAWSIYDEFPPEICAEAFYGYMTSIIDDDIMNGIHLEVRQVVDEMMRLELKLYIKAQKKMFARVNWPYPRLRGRQKPKSIPIPKPFIMDEKVMQNVENVLDLGIMSKPTTKIRDIKGDLNYIAYDYNITDPLATFPSPGFGDVKNRLVLSCVFGSGIQPGAKKNKAVLLLGQEKNGKSFLVDAVCGEMNAVKFDISPEVFSAVVKKPGKLLAKIFTAARVFQPSVIFLKNIEKVFCKKVAPEHRRLKAKGLKAPLTKLLKAMPATEKIIFIATCSKPFDAKAREMTRLFSEIILVPRPDHGTIQEYLYNSLQSIRSVERDLCVTGLAKVLLGFGFGEIMKMFKEVMTPERIVRLNVYPLQFSEFIEYLIANDLEAMTTEDYTKYMDFVINYSPLKKEREEYAIINKTRAYCYEKLAKKAAEDAAKKEAEAKGK